MSEQINMRCPSCNGGFLFIGAGGYLTCGFVGCPNPDVEAQVVALKQALTLIGDIGYDYDGYRTPDDLEKLIDEMVGYARNPQSAVDALTAE